MKIIYLSIGHVAAGVKKKLEDKTAFLNQAGVDTKLCLVGIDEKTEKAPTTELIPVDYKLARKVDRFTFFWRFSILFEQRNIYRAIDLFLKNQSYDLILFRYPVADYAFYQFMKKYGVKIIFEHNTIEDRELSIRKNESFYYKYFFLSEGLFGKKVRSLAKGLVGVTQEITHYQVDQCKSGKPAVTISNGIGVNRVPVRKNNSFDDSQLNILFLAGSEASWHGVDILLNALKRYRGDCKIHCYIAGNVGAKVQEIASAMDTVTLLSHQSGEELNALVDKCHIGVGSLGFTNEFLTQASTLKVREYWARGLPFVLGYDDTDLINNPAMKPFYLRTSHTGVLDMNEVINFVSQAYSINNISQQMRNLALLQIDYQVKTQAYISFFNSLQ